MWASVVAGAPPRRERPHVNGEVWGGAGAPPNEKPTSHVPPPDILSRSKFNYVVFVPEQRRRSKNPIWKAKFNEQLDKALYF